MNTKYIVFITGAFVTHHGWLPWKDYFESKGYTCIVKPWPMKDATANELRQRQGQDSELGLMRYNQVLEHYASIIKALPEKPILIGHSVGGLTTQLLLQRDLAVAGIALHPVPPQGVISLKWSFIKSVWKPLGLFTPARKTHLMSLSEWQYAFTNGMRLEDQIESYADNVIPESKTVLRDTLSATARIDFARPHAPLLILSGSDDHIIPASLNHSNYSRYRKNGSITDYQEFPDTNHFVVSQPGWRNQADFISHWLSTNGI